MTIPLYHSTTMDWVTTNIRFPESLYMELKIEAARRRKSIAAIIREKVATKGTTRKVAVNKILSEMKRVARTNEKYMKGVNLTKALIEMRSEQ